MQFPKFALHLKNLRAFRSKTVYEVAEAVGVSHTYISQMENGKKLPSLKVLFPLVLYLGSKNDKGFINKMENMEYDGTKLLEEYASYKQISGDDLLKEFMLYHSEKIMNEVKNFSNTMEARKENKVKMNRTNNIMTAIDMPHFDLKWLLNQKEYFVFYGDEYDLRNILEKKGSISNFDVYNILTDDDMKTISDLIEAFLSNKYKKVKEIGE